MECNSLHFGNRWNNIYIFHNIFFLLFNIFFPFHDTLSSPPLSYLYLFMNEWMQDFLTKLAVKLNMQHFLQWSMRCIIYFSGFFFRFDIYSKHFHNIRSAWFWLRIWSFFYFCLSKDSKMRFFLLFCIRCSISLAYSGRNINLSQRRNKNVFLARIFAKKFIHGSMVSISFIHFFLLSFSMVELIRFPSFRRFITTKFNHELFFSSSSSFACSVNTFGSLFYQIATWTAKNEIE